MPTSLIRGRLIRLSYTTFAALLFALAWLPASTAAWAQGAAPSPSYQIITRSPYAEVKFRGMQLVDVHQNLDRNELNLTFAQPVDSALFEQMAADASDWIDYAGANGTSATIHGRTPVNFAFLRDAEGFSLRLNPRADAPMPQQETLERFNPDDPAYGGPVARDALPYSPRSFEGKGSVPGDWRLGEHYAGYALAGREHGLRRSYDDSDGGFGLSGDYRHTSHQTVIAAGLRGALPIGDDFAIAGDVKWAHATGSIVRQLDGSYASVKKNAAAGALGFTYRGTSGDAITIQALLSEAGAGAHAFYVAQNPAAEFTIATDYHAPYMQTAEAIKDRAFIDRVEIGFVQEFLGLWLEGTPRLTRYGVDKDAAVAKTAGFSAGAHYLTDILGLTADFGYDVDAEYVLKRYAQPSILGGTFTPLDIREREIHSGSVALSGELGWGFWFDAYGGYAWDRYAQDGPFGGAALRFVASPSFDISAGLAYSAIPTRQGESGTQTSAGIALNYKLPTTF